MGTNVVVISGRLTADAVLKNVSGYDLSEFSIAFDVGWGDRKHAVFVPCKWWGKGAGAIHQWMIKGKQVTVTGQWDCEKWRGNNGIDQKKDLIIVSGVELGASPQNQGAGSDRPAYSEPPDTAFGEDIHF